MKGSKMKKMKKRILAALLCTTMMLNTGVSAMADGGTAVSSESAHVHTEECYEKSKTDNLICTKAEAAEGHVHGDTCYEVTSTPELICTQAETAGHTHDDSCMKTTKNLTCGTEEHTHGGDCYETETKDVCSDESEEHTCGDGCVETEEVLTCTAEEHTHDDGCYESETNIVCGQDEVEAHTHGEGCYTAVENKTLKCTLEEAEAHTHNDDCYAWEEKLVCTLPETAPAAEQPEKEEKAEEAEEAAEVNLQNDDETGIKVSVKSTSDVIPEDTKVVVAPMEMDEEHETALAEAVSEFEVLGYTAYDISLKDAEDEDITLGENKVEVTIDFEELIPEGINAEEVKDVVLVHITTDEEEKLTAETVGTVEITEEKATVEFEADSFSPYVVTYLSEAEEAVEEPIEEPAEEAVATECVFENDEMIVTVISETDNLDAVASIFVKQVAEEDEQYEVITQQLTEVAAENGKSSLGFYAYDIDFYDAAGNGIAVDGNVKVNVEFKEGKIPAEAEGENVDQVEVTVLDLDIDETEEAVLTDANGIYSAEECKVTEAAYTTENPDGFALAWYRNDEIVLETKVNGTVIKMTGPAESFPEGTEYSISAKELTSTQQDDVEAALRKMELEKETKVVSYQAYDIKLIVDGNETQPLGEVKVTFEGGAVEEKVDGAETVDVFHIDEAKQVAQPITNEINDNTVEMTTNHFSTYVITITSKRGATVTVEHYLDKGGSEEENRLYKTKEYELNFLTKLSEIAVETDHYSVSRIVKVTVNTSGNEEITKLYDATQDGDKNIDEVLDGTATYKVYYEPTKGNESGEIQMFDYMVKAQNGKKIVSINDKSNYLYSGDGQRFAIGSDQHTLDNVYLTPGGQNINKWTGNTTVVENIIKGVNYETGALIMNQGTKGQIYEPGLFTTETKVGKEILEGYSLEFSRSGDSYELNHVVKNNMIVADAGSEFFPLDDYDQSPYQEQVWADRKNKHNYYFGMRYNIAFTIGDYVGPLNYTFSGDDDLWVVLDAKDNGGRVVVDIGGIHLAANKTVDLWKYLDKEDPEVRNKEHTLTVLYLERGADQSNCTMKFTLPNSKIVGPTVNEVTFGLNLEKRIEGLTDKELAELKDNLTFEITTVGETAIDDNTPFVGTTVRADEMVWTDEDGVHVGRVRLTTTNTSVLLHEYIITESNEEVSGYEVASQVSVGNVVAQDVISPTIAFSASSISNTVIFTNTYTPSTQELDITKVWKDAENAYETRPEEISFKLQWRCDENADWQDYDSDDEGTDADVYVMKESENTNSANPNEWKLTVSGLPINKDGELIVYQAVEIIESGSNLAKYYRSTTNGTTMINQFDVQIVKVSSSDTDSSVNPPLAGAKFEAVKSDGTIFSGTSGSDGRIVWSIENGILPNGSYTFSETKAPTGYAVSEESWEIRVVDGVLVLPDGKVDMNNSSSEKVYSAYFENTPLYELPSTGGHGIYTTMFSGFALMLGAAYVWFTSRREENLQ